jgi:hypothetical protein
VELPLLAALFLLLPPAPLPLQLTLTLLLLLFPYGLVPSAASGGCVQLRHDDV